MRHERFTQERPRTVKELLLRMERTITLLEQQGSDVSAVRGVHDGLWMAYMERRRLSVAKATSLYWSVMSDNRICLRGPGRPAAAGLGSIR